MQGAQSRYAMLLARDWAISEQFRRLITKVAVF
jgi:hypothetical protein